MTGREPQAGDSVTVIRSFAFGPTVGAKGTVRCPAGPDGLVGVHIDGDPDHRSYGLPIADISVDDIR